MELARLVPVILVALLTAAAPAAASTVRLEPGSDEDVARLVYTAAAGEQNKLAVSVEGPRATIDDPGAGSITAQQGCTQVTPKRATCDLQDSTETVRIVEADLADGDDTFALTSGSTPFVGGQVSGGPGDDKLNGGPHGDRLDGGIGLDELRGHDGDDSFATGDTTGAADADLVDGGHGFDAFGGYAERTTPVSFDARTQTPAGEAGEGDALISVENLTGGHAGDTLHGDIYVDHLYGGNGDDVIFADDGNDYVNGGDGNDRLNGGFASDELYGGPGDDLLELNNRKGDAWDRFVSCDVGNDFVTGLIEALPAVSVDCERLDVGFGIVLPTMPRRVTKTSVAMSIPCPARFRDANGVCAGKLAVEPRMAFRKSARTRFRERYGAKEFRFTTQSARITVPLNARGRRELAKPVFRLQFTLRLTDQVKGRAREFAWTENLIRFVLRQNGVG